MILGRQINSLLKRHSAVFVKGLGTFRRIRTSASYDAKRNVVLPPLSYIEFEHDTTDGYDFTLYVQQSNHIENTQAELVVQKEVERLIDLIHTDGQATLDELGYLVSYGNGYIFKPLDLSGFQFVPIEDPYQNLEIQDQNVSASIEDSPKEVPISSTEASNQVNISHSDIQQNESVLYDEEESPRRSNAIVYALIAVVALIALGGIYYYSIISKKLENVDQYLSAMDSTEHDDILDSIPLKVDTNAIVTGDSTLLSSQDSLQSPIVEDKSATTVEKPADYKYTIVIGTHPKLVQAETEAAEYNKKGFKHVRALASNLDKNRKKVIWDTYPTKELRDSALRYVQKNIKADAWPTVLK